MFLRSFLSLLAVAVSVNALVTPNNNPQESASIGRRGALAKVVQAGAALAVGNVATPTASMAAIPETGVKAPFFELPNSRGEGSTSLGDLVKSGKWTVLYFYPGAFTSGCTLEAR